MALIPIEEIDRAVAGLTAPRRYVDTVRANADVVALLDRSGIFHQQLRQLCVTWVGHKVF